MYCFLLLLAQSVKETTSTMQYPFENINYKHPNSLLINR